MAMNVSNEGRKSPAPQAKKLSSALALLATGVIATPLAFGATEVWAYCGLQFLAAAASMCWVASGARPWPLVWLPLAVAALGFAQTIPLPSSGIQRIAPLTGAARIAAEELVDQPLSGGTSVNAAQTHAALRRCLMLALVVLITAGVARIERFRRTLLYCVASVGALILLLGLLVGTGPDRRALGFHDMNGYWKNYKNPLLSGFHSEGMGYADVVTVGRIHYVASSPVVGAPMGAMINANHFAACVGLTLPVVVGLMISRSMRSPSRTRYIVLAVAYAALGAYAVAVPAHARGGFAALGLTGLVIAAAWASPTRSRPYLIAVAPCALAALFAVVLIRFDLIQRIGGRNDAWGAAIDMFRQSSLLGVGLGNYETVYPALRTGPIAYLAHSVWLECAAEAGAVGLAFAAVAWGGIGWCVSRVGERNVPADQRVLRLGVHGGVLFAALHGAVDHGVQIPANAFLCAILIGILLGDLRSENASAVTPAVTGRSRGQVVLGRLLVVGCAVFLVYGGLREIQADRLILPLRRAIAMQRVPGESLLLDERPELLLAALSDAERAFGIVPHKADFADLLGQAHLHLSRGSDRQELQLAADWFSLSLRLSPVNPWTTRTLLEIREQVDNPAPLPTINPRRPRREAADGDTRTRRPDVNLRRNSKPGATSARPGRSEP